MELFGKIDINNLEECYEGSLPILGNTVEIELNFESESIDRPDLEKVEDFISSIETFAKKALEVISEDFDSDKKDGTVKLYLEHHLDEFTEDEIMEIFGTKDVDKNVFCRHLKICSIALYPEDDDSYAVFDIQLPEEYTDYLLAVTFTADGEVSDLSMES